MNDRGSILPLIAGAVMLTLVMVVGISAATSLLVERSRLFALADSVAVVAAESFNPRTVTRGSAGVRAPMTSAEVRANSAHYLQAVGPGRLLGLVLERAVTIDNRVVEVTLSSAWRPPMVSQFFPSNMRVRVTARAQVFIR
jgi:hypothetical protein